MKYHTIDGVNSKILKSGDVSTSPSYHSHYIIIHKSTPKVTLFLKNGYVSIYKDKTIGFTKLRKDEKRYYDIVRKV